MPKIVEQAPMGPGQCLVSQDIEGPWFDCGVKAPWVNPYCYLSVKYVEQLAGEVGMVNGREVEKEVEDLKNKVAVYAAKVEQLSALNEATEKLEELEEGAGI